MAPVSQAYIRQFVFLVTSGGSIKEYEETIS